MRRTLVVIAVTALLIAVPASAFAAPPGAFGSEGQAAWAVYSLELEGFGWAELWVGGSSSSYSNGEFGEEVFSEADFSIYGEGFDCFGYTQVPFELDQRLSGTSIDADLQGECYFYDPGDGGEGDGEFEILHEGDGEGEPEFVPISATLQVEFVGTGLKQNSNGFWREPGYRCSSHGSSRSAEASGTLTIDGPELLPALFDLASPDDARLSRYEESCQATGSPGPG